MSLDEKLMNLAKYFIVNYLVSFKHTYFSLEIDKVVACALSQVINSQKMTTHNNL